MFRKNLKKSFNSVVSVVVSLGILAQPYFSHNVFADGDEQLPIEYLEESIWDGVSIEQLRIKPDSTEQIGGTDEEPITRDVYAIDTPAKFLGFAEHYNKLAQLAGMSIEDLRETCETEKVLGILETSIWCLIKNESEEVKSKFEEMKSAMKIIEECKEKIQDFVDKTELNYGDNEDIKEDYISKIEELSISESGRAILEDLSSKVDFYYNAMCSSSDYGSDYGNDNDSVTKYEKLGIRDELRSASNRLSELELELKEAFLALLKANLTSANSQKSALVELFEAMIEIEKWMIGREAQKEAEAVPSAIGIIESSEELVKRAAEEELSRIQNCKIQLTKSLDFDVIGYANKSKVTFFHDENGGRQPKGTEFAPLELFYRFSQIGTEKYPFKGEFSGEVYEENEKKIAKISGLVLENKEGKDIGLFGCIEGATIHDLCIDDDVKFRSVGDLYTDKNEMLSYLRNTNSPVKNGGNCGLVLKAKGNGNKVYNVENKGTFVSQGRDGREIICPLEDFSEESMAVGGLIYSKRLDNFYRNQLTESLLRCQRKSEVDTDVQNYRYFAIKDSINNEKQYAEFLGQQEVKKEFFSGTLCAIDENNNFIIVANRGRKKEKLFSGKDILNEEGEVVNKDRYGVKYCIKYKDDEGKIKTTDPFEGYVEKVEEKDYWGYATGKFYGDVNNVIDTSLNFQGNAVDVEVEFPDIKDCSKKTGELPVAGKNAPYAIKWCTYVNRNNGSKKTIVFNFRNDGIGLGNNGVLDWFENFFYGKGYFVAPCRNNRSYRYDAQDCFRAFPITCDTRFYEDSYSDDTNGSGSTQTKAVLAEDGKLRLYSFNYSDSNETNEYPDDFCLTSLDYEIIGPGDNSVNEVVQHGNVGTSENGPINEENHVQVDFEKVKPGSQINLFGTTSKPNCKVIPGHLIYKDRANGIYTAFVTLRSDKCVRHYMVDFTDSENMSTSNTKVVSVGGDFNLSELDVDENGKVSLEKLFDTCEKIDLAFSVYKKAIELKEKSNSGKIEKTELISYLEDVITKLESRIPGLNSMIEDYVGRPGDPGPKVEKNEWLEYLEAINLYEGRSLMEYSKFNSLFQSEKVLAERLVGTLSCTIDFLNRLKSCIDNINGAKMEESQVSAALESLDWTYCKYSQLVQNVEGEDKVLAIDAINKLTLDLKDGKYGYVFGNTCDEGLLQSELNNLITTKTLEDVKRELSGEKLKNLCDGGNGGSVGLIAKVLGKVEMENCTSSGDIVSRGGKVGTGMSILSSGGNLNSDFYVNENSNKTYLMAGNGGYAGAMIGYLSGSADLLNCNNAAYVDACGGGTTTVASVNDVFDSKGGSGGYAGGLVGLADTQSDSYDLTFENCINYGDILSSSGATSCSSGMSGGNRKSGTIWVQQVIGDKTLGTALTTGNAGQAGCAGGLAGASYLKVILKGNCENRGKINACSPESGSTGGCVGTFTRRNKATGLMLATGLVRCANGGAAGGLIGILYNKLEIVRNANTSLINTGSVDASGGKSSYFESVGRVSELEKSNDGQMSVSSSPLLEISKGGKCGKCGDAGCAGGIIGKVAIPNGKEPFGVDLYNVENKGEIIANGGSFDNETADMICYEEEKGWNLYVFKKRQRDESCINDKVNGGAGGNGGFAGAAIGKIEGSVTATIDDFINSGSVSANGGTGGNGARLNKLEHGGYRVDEVDRDKVATYILLADSEAVGGTGGAGGKAGCAGVIGSILGGTMTVKSSANTGAFQAIGGNAGDGGISVYGTGGDAGIVAGSGGNVGLVGECIEGGTVNLYNCGLRSQLLADGGIIGKAGTGVTLGTQNVDQGTGDGGYVGFIGRCTGSKVNLGNCFTLGFASAKSRTALGQGGCFGGIAGMADAMDITANNFYNSKYAQVSKSNGAAGAIGFLQGNSNLQFNNCYYCANFMKNKIGEMNAELDLKDAHMKRMNKNFMYRKAFIDLLNKNKFSESSDVRYKKWITDEETRFPDMF